MKIRAALLAASTISLLATLAPTAHAASAATCAASSKVTLSPGISMKPSSGTFTSTPGGTLACVGVVKGVKVGGKGTLSFKGAYGPGDTCSSGKGSGTLAATLPKVGGGQLAISGTFTVTRVGPEVIVKGKLAGAQLAGNLQFLPKTGQNCVQTKVTSATVAGGALSLG